jgi:DNA-directed RNA polymerase subunit M/transcription elongation factor TFIIS
MQKSNNKREEDDIESQNMQFTKTKLSRQARTCKNKKLKYDQKQTEMLHKLDVDISLVIDNIVFDPSRH